MPEGSIVDPGNHPSVYTVGAVRADRYVFNDPEPFSSQGPTLDGLQKPDISGPDGLTTHAFGPIGFYGTSASTPAVTGALALLMSEDLSQSPYDAADRLSESAIWEDHPNQDSRFGGRARPKKTAAIGLWGVVLRRPAFRLWPSKISFAVRPKNDKVAAERSSICEPVTMSILLCLVMPFHRSQTRS